MKMKMFGVSVISSLGTLMLYQPMPVNGIRMSQPVNDYMSFAELISSSDDDSVLSRDVHELAETDNEGFFGDVAKKTK